MNCGREERENDRCFFSFSLFACDVIKSEASVFSKKNIIKVDVILKDPVFIFIPFLCSHFLAKKKQNKKPPPLSSITAGGLGAVLPFISLYPACTSNILQFLSRFLLVAPIWVYLGLDPLP